MNQLISISPLAIILLIVGAVVFWAAHDPDNQRTDAHDDEYFGL